MKHADSELRQVRQNKQAEFDDARSTREAREARDMWAKFEQRDPELARIQHRNAVAARMLAITPESHASYPAWDLEYRRAGEELLALWKRRRDAC